MKKAACFILCIVLVGCSSLKQPGHSAYTGANPEKKNRVDPLVQIVSSENRTGHTIVCSEPLRSVEDTCVLKARISSTSQVSGPGISNTAAHKKTLNHFPARKVKQPKVNKTADTDTILLVAVILIIILALLTGGTLFLIAGLADTTWWMIILAGVLIYMGLCCLLGFIGLAFGDRARPSERFN